MVGKGVAQRSEEEVVLVSPQPDPDCPQSDPA